MYTNASYDELTQLFTNEYRSNGFCSAGVQSAERFMRQLFLLYLEQNEYEGAARSLVDQEKQRYENQHLSKSYYLITKRTAARFVEFCKTGTIDFRRDCDEYKNITINFLPLFALFTKNTAWSESIRHHVNYNAKIHFRWLAENDVLSIKDVNHYILRNYLSQRSNQLSGCGMRDTMFSLKKMYCFLFDEGYIAESFEGLLSYSVSITKKFKPALPDIEVALMLQAIDKATAMGKRNYAILILACVTGLRSSDIAGLKISDVDWRSGEIRITQKKTSNSLALPLTEDVGVALKNYILAGRPASASQNIFLTTKAPYQPLSTKGGITSVYKSVRRQAGLPREAFDGKSFHAFRRSLGRNLLIAGTPIPDIAQILGHVNIESTRIYIPLDLENIKNCALSFDGIRPTLKNDAIVQRGCALDFNGLDPASCKERTTCCALNFNGIERKGGATW